MKQKMFYLKLSTKLSALKIISPKKCLGLLDIKIIRYYNFNKNIWIIKISLLNQTF